MHTIIQKTNRIKAKKTPTALTNVSYLKLRPHASKPGAHARTLHIEYPKEIPQNDNDVRATE